MPDDPHLKRGIEDLAHAPPVRLALDPAAAVALLMILRLGLLDRCAAHVANLHQVHAAANAVVDQLAVTPAARHALNHLLELR